MVEALCPGVNTLLIQVNDIIAEATPEVCLEVGSNSLLAGLALNNLIVGDVVYIGKMCFKRCNLVENLRAAFLVTSPLLRLIVLAILVALPIVLAAESLLALGESTPVRALMTLHVFSA
jgi:hypothetical protein